MCFLKYKRMLITTLLLIGTIKTADEDPPVNPTSDGVVQGSPDVHPVPEITLVQPTETTKKGDGRLMSAAKILLWPVAKLYNWYSSPNTPDQASTPAKILNHTNNSGNKNVALGDAQTLNTHSSKSSHTAAGGSTTANDASNDVVGDVIPPNNNKSTGNEQLKENKEPLSPLVGFRDCHKKPIKQNATKKPTATAATRTRVNFGMRSLDLMPDTITDANPNATYTTPTANTPKQTHTHQSGLSLNPLSWMYAGYAGVKNGLKTFYNGCAKAFNLPNPVDATNYTDCDNQSWGINYSEHNYFLSTEIKEINLVGFSGHDFVSDEYNKLKSKPNENPTLYFIQNGCAIKDLEKYDSNYKRFSHLVSTPSHVSEVDFSDQKFIGLENADEYIGYGHLFYNKHLVFENLDDGKVYPVRYHKERFGFFYISDLGELLCLNVKYQIIRFLIEGSMVMRKLYPKKDYDIVVKACATKTCQYKPDHFVDVPSPVYDLSKGQKRCQSLPPLRIVQAKTQSTTAGANSKSDATRQATDATVTLLTTGNANSVPDVTKNNVPDTTTTGNAVANVDLAGVPQIRKATNDPFVLTDKPATNNVVKKEPLKLNPMVAKSTEVKTDETVKASGKSSDRIPFYKKHATPIIIGAVCIVSIPAGLWVWFTLGKQSLA